MCFVDIAESRRLETSLALRANSAVKLRRVSNS